VYPFERFAEDAKKSLTLAQEEAERSHHSYIGTEHLLLGILRNQDGVGHKVLTNLGLHIDVVRQTIESVLGRDERIIIQQIVPTSRVKQVIEISFEEARRMGAQSVNSAHLLMGLVIEGEGIAAHVLEDLGAGAARVIAAVESEMGAPPSGRGKGKASRGFFRPWRPEIGATSYVARMRAPVPSASAAETLARLLQRPEVIRLLKVRGLDVDKLGQDLREPPEGVIKLRFQLQTVRNELSAAAAQQDYELAARHEKKAAALAKRLEQAEQEWLGKLGT
jgi:ATP-dependent Clp protease ATP-binding subunit ClpA